MNPVHIFPRYVPKIRSNIIIPFTSRSSEWCIPFRFSDQILYAVLIFPTRVIYPVHLILRYFISLIIFGDAYSLRSSSLCSLLQCPVTSSLLDPNIRPALCSQIPCICIVPLVWQNTFRTHTKQQVIITIHSLGLSIQMVEWYTKTGFLKEACEICVLQMEFFRCIYRFLNIL
jgi:hypothetical protein